MSAGPSGLAVRVRAAVYRHFADTGAAPDNQSIAKLLGASPDEVISAFRELRANRVLFLEDDAASIRMAPPFSAVPTQHRVRAGTVEYFGNCAWDALGTLAALHQPGVIESRCEQSMEPLRLEVGVDGPVPGGTGSSGAGGRGNGSDDWVFHSLVPAAKWWDDLVFT
jgi:hypothetical protein